MRVGLTTELVLLRLRRFIAACLAFCLAASLVLPGLGALASAVSPAIELMAEDCPLHEGGGQGHERPGLHDCGCILCYAPGTPNTNFAPDIFIPASHLSDAALSFATGVSATHGPRETANLSTGPPAL